MQGFTGGWELMEGWLARGDWGDQCLSSPFCIKRSRLTLPAAIIYNALKVQIPATIIYNRKSSEDRRIAALHVGCRKHAEKGAYSRHPASKSRLMEHLVFSFKRIHIYIHAHHHIWTTTKNSLGCETTLNLEEFMARPELCLLCPRSYQAWIIFDPGFSPQKVVV